MFRNWLETTSPSYLPLDDKLLVSSSSSSMQSVSGMVHQIASSVHFRGQQVLRRGFAMCREQRLQSPTAVWSRPHHDQLSFFVASDASRSARLSRRSNDAKSFVSITAPCFQKKIVNVPTMGDSITEGSIVEWSVQVGQAVHTDDVVALIETDKVTVEIKATTDGVITQQFGAVEDTVEVGAKLYEIDTDATPTVAAADTVGTSGGGNDAPAASESSESSSEEPEAVVAASEKPIHSRTPSIHFLQKKGWAKRKAGMKQVEAASDDVVAPTPSPRVSPFGVTTYVVESVPPMYGRPKFTEAEMDALVCGGANLIS